MYSIRVSYNTDVIVKKLKKLNLIPDSAVGVLMIKDCILIQNYTGKTYTYNVINFVSGDNKYLFNKKNFVTDKDYKNIVKKIISLPFFNIKYPKDGIQMIDYIFKNVFPEYGYTIIEEQINLSKNMFSAMKNRKILLSDIAVGLGKTHAYLVAAIIHNIFTRRGIEIKSMPIIISTSNIELQRAIIRDYIPDISRMLYENGIITKPITCVLRKGKENYLCEKRLLDYVNSLDPKIKRECEYTELKKLTENNKLDLDEIKGISKYDKRKICVKSKSCFNCKKYLTCSYQRFMRNARKSYHDFLICNHNYFFADLLRRKKGLTSLLPEHNVIIIDEVHKLTGAAQKMYSTSINQNEIYSLMKKAMPKNEKTKINKISSDLCNEVIRDNDLLFKELIWQIPEHTYISNTKKFNTVITLRANMFLKRIIDNFEELLKIMPYENRKLMTDIKRSIEDIKVFKHNNIIYWIEKPNVKGQSILFSIPMMLSKEISKDLWHSINSILLTSGTISVNGDFDYIKKELGLNTISENKIVEVSKLSPFNFVENCMIYIADNIPLPNIDNDKYISRVTEEVYKLIKASNGYALILFTSYKSLKKVYKNLLELITDIPIIEMSRGRSNAIVEFKKSKNSVLLAAGSMWEEINIPDDILSHLIIVKLPFPIPDPISEYKKTLYEDISGFRNSVLIPKMLIKLRQGVGRLIRSEKDTGVISILDSRASKKGNYHEVVIKALPKCTVTSSINDIEKFINVKKEKDYFINKEN